MDLRHMYWHNGCKMTVKRMAKENGAKRLNPEVIKKINDGVERMADENSTDILRMKEESGLSDWQWEQMLKNESDNEDWG